MNYIGSKYSLLPFIEKVFRRIYQGSDATICDLFAGTGAVGRRFKERGLRIIANDLQYYAYALNKAYIEIDQTPAFKGALREIGDRIHEAGDDPAAVVLAFLDRLPGVKGFIAGHYGPEGKRFYYTEANAEKADAIRQTIERWRERRVIDEQEYFYLLCSLLEAIDQVANTASVYGAYLKKFKSTALKPLRLKPLVLHPAPPDCRVFQRDANELVREIECDVLYLDPPYNHRQYGANYHVLETIAAYDSPRLSGVTGMREYQRSLYCQQSAAADALEDLVRNANAAHILLSYNDEGVLRPDQIRRILKLRGKPRTFRRRYTRYKADNGRAYKRDATIEHLHYVNTASGK
jgi:adenine-specific DNA-methyltransferase